MELTNLFTRNNYCDQKPAVMRKFRIVFMLGIAALAAACNTNKKVVQNYATEQYRPQFHFTRKTNWMNDPNGMVYLHGTYHLFFQHSPGATVSGAIAPRVAAGEGVSIKLLVDVASAEVFTDDGLSVLTNIFFSEEPLNQLYITSTGPLHVKKITYSGVKPSIR
jgi:sucrose-6-phosphate hydrolase SacC (GH32 family)